MSTTNINSPLTQGFIQNNPGTAILNFYGTTPVSQKTRSRREFYPLTFSPPPHYIPRPTLLEQLRHALLTPSDQVMAITSALHGMGGIGKSVMARALCDDSEVKARFTNGTLVAVLGEQPNLTQNLRDWVQTLGGTITENAPSLDYLSNLLRECLHDQAYLLVLDDVWQVAHARPFLQGGRRCRVLLTTRNLDVARQLAATVHATPTMQQDEAVALLDRYADSTLTFTLQDKIRVVKRLGYLPLAIRLAGAQLHCYESVESWLAEFKAIKDEKYRPYTLIILTPQLKGEAKQIALTQALQSTLAIKNEQNRVRALITLIPQLAGTELIQCQTELRPTIIAGLVNRQRELRQSVLEFLSIEGLFSPTALGLPTAGMVEAMVGHINEICTQWRWG